MSKRFSLNLEDIKKIVTGAGIAALGGALAWISTNVIPQLQGAETVEAIALATALSVGVNVLRKLIAGPK